VRCWDGLSRGMGVRVMGQPLIVPRLALSMLALPGAALLALPRLTLWVLVLPVVPMLTLSMLTLPMWCCMALARVLTELGMLVASPELGERLLALLEPLLFHRRALALALAWALSSRRVLRRTA